MGQKTKSQNTESNAFFFQKKSNSNRNSTDWKVKQQVVCHLQTSSQLDNIETKKEAYVNHCRQMEDDHRGSLGKRKKKRQWKVESKKKKDNVRGEESSVPSLCVSFLNKECAESFCRHVTDKYSHKNLVSSSL